MGESAETAFRRHYGQVYRYVRRRTDSVEQAEDITQDVFAASARDLERFLPGATPVLAWLYTIAQRRLIDEARRAGRRPQAAEVPLELVPTSESEYGARTAAVLRAALTGLPEGQRQVVVAKLLEGHGFAEIAGQVGCSESACKMRFLRGLERLRRELEEEGVTP